MEMLWRIKDLLDGVTSASDADQLAEAIRAICPVIGFEYFALSHHVDIIRTGSTAIHLHNYPDQWAQYYENNALGVSDPVHRASHVTSFGFIWSDIPDMISLTPQDRRILAMGQDQGIGDGFTVPANVPGEARGSCSFANTSGCAMPLKMLPLAQYVGAFAFEAARRVWSVRAIDPRKPTLTDRQRDCMLWVARGKSDWEIARILGVSEETVTRHVKQACGRYGVNKRILLTVQTLFDGTLTLGDIFRR